MSNDDVKVAVRIPASLHERLTLEAKKRVISVNLLMTRAIEDFLNRFDGQ